MRICIISRDIDLPPDEGASVKLYYTAQKLAESGHTVYYVSNQDSYSKVESDRWLKKSYPPLICSLFRALPLIKRILLRLGVPDKDWILFHPLLNFNLFLKLLYVAFKERIDILQAEFPAYQFPTALVALVTNKKSILVEHNIETFRIESTTRLKPAGKSFIAKVEALASKLEDKVVTVSDEDKKRLSSLGVTKDRIEIIPHGVDRERFEQGEGGRIKRLYSLEGRKVVLFHGVLSYPPNQRAVQELETKIFPQLEKKLEGKVKLLVVGKYHEPGKNGNVIYTGRVNKIEDYLQAADVAVVPLRAGGGTRLKILEYFAAGVPVVSTRKGAEGLEVEDGRELLLADQPEEMIDEVIGLFNSQQRREELVNEAKRFVRKKDWLQVAREYEKLYHKLLTA